MITILNRKMYWSTGNLRRRSKKHGCPTLYQICPSQDHMLVPALILNLDNFLVLVPCIYDCSLHLKVFPQMNMSWEFQYVFKNRFYTKKKLRRVRLSISLPYTCYEKRSVLKGLSIYSTVYSWVLWLRSTRGHRLVILLRPLLISCFSEVFRKKGRRRVSK